MKRHKKNQQHEFIEKLYDYCIKSNTPNLLQQLIEARKQTILSKLSNTDTGNLSYLFSTKEAIELIGKHPCSILPKHYFMIEQLAHKLFGCLLRCWTEFEIFRTIQHSSNNYHIYSKQEHINSESNIINEDYHYEIVNDISKDKRLFYTDFCEQPLLLSDAIVLINITTFIKEHKWYEMLSILDISSKGEHFILYQLKTNNSYPTIISSALIEPYQDKANWLFFNDFFQTKHWKSEGITDSLLSFFPNLKTKYSNASSLGHSNLSSSDLENAIFSSIVDKRSVCGVIRFTINGPRPKLNQYMYLAQKGLANALYNSGREMIFSIIEQPAMVLFYQAINNDNCCTPFLFTSQQDINNSGLITYKGICLTKHTSNVFNQYDLKSYNAKIIKRRKDLKQR
ncbi:acyl-homoserine-lactone synthase [Aliivibrio wodanis]|uniref:acyl-homoserine-lactone synthase n=1 Tax=Aliivibrio wodanis TaxID=80852 RepID=UPI00406C8730